jgi:peptidyl-prolyl cis-trans isomerase SurA
LKHILFIIFIFFKIVAFHNIPLSAQQEGDRVLAIVGNDIILESDLSNKLYIYASQNKLKEINEHVIQTVFQNLLAEKLILAKAEQDSIEVTEDEINKQLDYRIQSLIQQYGSEKNLEEMYGLTINNIKSYLKVDITKQIKIERLKRQKFGEGIKLSRNDVIKFYNDYKDSIPDIPETFELYQIAKKVPLPDEAKLLAKVKAQNILDSIKFGADFSLMAKTHSDDSASAANGGDLGKVKKGSFVKEFEDAAYLLEAGQVSELVETKFGYHIIKLIEKSGNQIRAAHILIQFPHLESADFETINFLKDIKSQATNNEKLFKEFAYKYSDDQTSVADSGYIGKISLNNLDSNEITAIKDLKPGEISNPIMIGTSVDYAYHIFMLINRYPEHKAELKTDYEIIEKMAQNYKESKELNAWLEELKKTIYVEIKQ